MSNMLSHVTLEGGKGKYGEGTFCYVCKNPLKRLPSAIGAGDYSRPWEEVYSCERGHVYSGEALIELSSYELP